MIIIVKITEDGIYTIQDGLENREEIKKLTAEQIEQVKKAIKILNTIEINDNHYQTGGFKVSFETKKRFLTFYNGLIDPYNKYYNKKLDDAVKTIFKLSPIEIKPRYP